MITKWPREKRHPPIDITTHHNDKLNYEHYKFIIFQAAISNKDEIKIKKKKKIMVFDATFKQYFSYIMAASCIGGGNQRTQRKTTDLSQVTDKLTFYTCFYQQYSI